jgi:CheY-like chemotaxis protein
VGKGSRFWFRIRVRSLSDTPDTYRNARGERLLTSGQLAGRVLLVEDTFTNQLIISELLKKLGLEFFVAEDGQQALEGVQGGAVFDLILMDLQMPVMDGFQATRFLREWEQANGKARIPIIALTADAYAEDRAKCRDAGMDDFLPKPVNFSELVDVLERYLPGRVPQQELPSGVANVS